MADTILDIQNLCLYGANGSALLKGISFSLKRGETVGLVGESGSGKTLTLRSCIGLLPEGIRETYTEKTVTGSMAMIFQNPMSALDPVTGVFSQLCEVIRFRKKLNKKETVKEAERILKRLSLPSELSRKDRIPSELSGGQCQRLLIGMALSCDPDILFCDEPTTALDVTVQKQVLDLISDLQHELQFSVIFVTHNLAVAGKICERLIVMKDGEIVEEGPTDQILHDPTEAYTRKLLHALLSVPENPDDSQKEASHE